MGAHTRGDYIAILETERPVSHHPYLYERRRSGNWIADVWRRGDGTQEEITYFNAVTGASVVVGRDAAGEIRTVSVTQASDSSFDTLEPTEERDVHLGESCTIWRARPRPPGAQMLRESCVTDDGVELWSQMRHSGHPTRPGYTSGRVEVSSLSRRRIAPTLARPPREVFNWAYWRERAASGVQPAPTDTPPDHSVWFEDGREAASGRVIREQYSQNTSFTVRRAWHQQGESYDYAWVAPGLSVHGRMDTDRNARRQLDISLSVPHRGWRPDPATVVREQPPQTILGRQCYWLTPRNPPEDAFGSACWTDDNIVLARMRAGRGGRQGEAAVRLDMGAPRAPLEPPPQVFAWARAVTAD
jgi:hypothetical protein